MILEFAIFAAVFAIMALVSRLSAKVLHPRYFRKVEQGTVLIRTGFTDDKISFNGCLVIPLIHDSEVLDVTVKRIEIDRRAQESLICKDNLRADIKVVFSVRVNQTHNDIFNAYKSPGCEKALDTESLKEFFEAKFSEALETAAKKFDYARLHTDKEQFKNQIIEAVGTDLNGFVLDDVAVNNLEQSDEKQLIADNIPGAEAAGEENENA
ncbi:MAG: hypothetical protein GY765_32010 [bacterium]|nr:hypothetical protein [bacterium]